MLRIRSATVLVLATALSAALVPAADGARRKAPCKPAKSKTIVQNASVRVYEVANDEGSIMYGCRRSTGRRVGLDSASDDGLTTSSSYDHVQLAGSKVAWVSTDIDQSCKADCPPDFESTSIRIGVTDVKTRKTRSVAAKPDGAALVLSEDGGVAWATSPTAGVTEIHASVRGTEDKVLDSGAIDPASLGIEITIVSWTRDGAERFARLR